MSADLTIADPCEHCGRVDQYDANWTYNLSPMQRDAIGVTLHEGEPDGGEFADRLKRLIAAFEADPARYRALNPENGWGDYDQFLKHLREIREWMQDRNVDNLTMDWWL